MDQSTFVQQYSHLGIPADLLSLLWRASRPRTPPEGLVDALSRPPSREEFEEAIRHAPKDSAAGMSGLSYNMVRCWPKHFIDAAFSALDTLWDSSVVPSQWRWRWLIPIPKVPNPSLTDLRPLCLNEALRKLWFSAIIRRLQSFWATGGIRPTQHGFVLL